MADDTENGKPPKRPLHVVGSRASHPAKPSEAQVHQLYMASPYVEWAPFSRSMGWDDSSRTGLPIGKWAEEKRGILARQQAENIADAVFSHKGRWHQDVLKTLKEYPEANDAMMGIIKRRLNDIIVTINEDEANKVRAAQTGEAFIPQFATIKNSELASLAGALRTITDAKHRSLLINDWSFKVAEGFSDPKQFADQAHRVADQEWKVEIIGGENLTARQVQELLGSYYDQPLLDATPAAEGE